MGYLIISRNVRRYQTHYRWQFFFQEDSALLYRACNTVQLLQRSRLIQHLSEKCDFLCFPVLPGSAESHVIWDSIVKYLLTAYFIGNISTEKISKSVHVCQSYSKTKVWRFSETRCRFLRLTNILTYLLTYLLIKTDTVNKSCSIKAKFHYAS